MVRKFSLAPSAATAARATGAHTSARTDVKSIATYIGMDPEQFEKKYCATSGDRWVLAQQENGFCVFWQDRMCGIHPVKPKMCKAWPFIRNLLVDPGNWEKMASMCPGIRKGVPAEVVQKCVETMLGHENERMVRNQPTKAQR